MNIPKKKQILSVTRYPEFFAGILLKMARDGMPRPRITASCPAEKKLAGRLTSYVLPGRRDYRPAFEREIKRLAPGWFKMRFERRKEDLLAWARSGAPRPRSKRSYGASEQEVANGQTLCIIARKLGRGGDPELMGELRALRPDWFKVVKNDAWSHIMEAAKSGKPRPSRVAKSERERSMAHSLGLAMVHTASRIDKKRLKALKNIRPDWFGTRPRQLDEKVQKLLQIARRGEARPLRSSKDSAERKLAMALSNLVSRPRGREKQVEELRRAAPEWFATVKKRQKK